ncbi:MAG: LURP-one-related/scramblase family protein [Nocardioidaceae bacterium]
MLGQLDLGGDAAKATAQLSWSAGTGRNRMAMVKKSLISPLRDRWTVEIEGGPDLDIKGNIVDHEYTFTDGRTPVATVSKRWFRVADTYGVEVEPGQNPVVVLAATVALDMMSHEDG